MNKLNNSEIAFLALVRAGLWEDIEVNDGHTKGDGVTFAEVNFKEVYRLAQEQSVVGLVAAGLERIKEANAPKEQVLSMVSDTLQLEQRNKDMNAFIKELMEILSRNGIHALLVKGLGIAQCYNRPLWRACGDIDLLLRPEDYSRTKDLLMPMAFGVDDENTERLHIGLNISQWVVELHGTLRGQLLRRIDRIHDAIQKDLFESQRWRIWHNGSADILLPAVDDDVVIVFAHILQHFFWEGIGLRQICDWCRLLWTYRDSMDVQHLELQIKQMGLMSEWQAFSALAVDWLGMPADAMPMFSTAKRWSKCASNNLMHVLEAGNFGHNRDYSYYEKYPYVMFKAISFWRHTMNSLRHFMIFPLDAIKVWWNRMIIGVKTVAKGN